MKKWIPVIFLYTLLFALFLPASATTTSEEDILGEGVCEEPYTVVFDVPVSRISTEEELLAHLENAVNTPSKRAKTENNLIFPGPMVQKASIQPKSTANFPMGIYQTGKANQYMVILLYEGKEPKGDPVVTIMEPFPQENKGLYTKHIENYIGSINLGRYTMVTCTAEPKGSTLYPVEGTAYMTDIYCYNYYCRRWDLFIEDIQTGEELDMIRVWAQEPLTVALGRSPLPSDCRGGLLYSCPQNLVEIQEAGGYFFLTPKRCGFGSISITHRSEKIIEVPISVCTAKGGHIAGSVTPALEPTPTSKGLYVYSCSACGSIYREEIPSFETDFQRFTDVPSDTWYYESVKEAFFRQLFNGVSSTEFKPTQAMNRAMLVTVLWRLEGSPEGSAPQFTDVPVDSWYAEAVNWAAEKQVVNGVGKGKFNPLGTITREQLGTILYRYSQMMGYDTDFEESDPVFADYEQVSTWARAPMNWAIARGIIGGVQKGNERYLDPQGKATRAQVCAILIRFLRGYEESIEETELPDITLAEDHGKWYDLTWAYYPDGTLRIGGASVFEDGGGVEDYPWLKYYQVIRRVEILNGVSAVGKYAFMGYTALETLILGDSVTAIRQEAFMGCTSLKEVKLSEKLEIISRKVFEGCSALQEIQIPYGVKQIGDRAFANCRMLRQIRLPSSIVGYYGMTSKETPNGIGDEVFMHCVSLTYAELPVAVRHLPNRFFYNCSSLQEVSMPLTLEYVGEESFGKCKSLKSVVLMFNLTELHKGAFSYCDSLKEVYVLSPYYKLDNPFFYPITEESAYIFGHPEQVTVYGLKDSLTEQLCILNGYTFVDIEQIIE